LPFLPHLCFCWGSLDMLPYAGASSTRLPFFPLKIARTASSPGGEAGGDVEQLAGVDRRAAPELAHEVPAGRALEEGMYDLGLGHTWELHAALREAPYEVPERLAGLLGARARVPEVPRAHVRPLEVPPRSCGLDRPSCGSG
jgi:hypothetical protein